MLPRAASPTRSTACWHTSYSYQYEHLGSYRQDRANGFIGGFIGNDSNRGHVQRQLIVNGEVLARYGDELVVGANGSTTPTSVVEFQFGASALNVRQTSLDAQRYTVTGGETLRSIARAFYGDDKLWYLIAQANGLSGSSQLSSGQTLSIPKLSASSNGADSFQPYDPSKVLGDLTPNLPMPHNDHGCGGLGQIIMIVVAIVVTIYTAGAMSGAAAQFGGGFMGTMQAGAGAMMSGSVGIAGGAAAAAAGSIASQLVGNAIGAVDGFSWKSVALSALSAGVSGGLGGVDFTGSGVLNSMGNVVARAAIGNAVSQGIGVATGLQKSFDWKGVAASAVGAGVGYGMNEAMGLTHNGLPTNNYTGFDKFALAGLSGFAAGAAAAAARGGRVSITQVATDAFGNALGSAVVDMMLPQNSAQQSFRVGEINDQNWDARIQTALSQAGPGRWDDEALPSMADRYAQTYGGEVTQASDRLRVSRGGLDDLDQQLRDAKGVLNMLDRRDAARASANAAPAAGLMVDPETGLASFAYTSRRMQESDGTVLPTTPYLSFGNQITSDPLVEVFRGMSKSEFDANMNERGGGLEYFSRGKNGGAGNLYVTTNLDYTIQLDTKSEPGKYGNYVRLDIDKLAYDRMVDSAFTENPATQEKFPNNQPYSKETSPGYRDKFTLKQETGKIINIGIGEGKAAEFNGGVVSTTVLRNYDIDVAEGQKTNGPGYDPTRFAPEGALKFQSVLGNVGKGLTGVAIGLDGKRLYDAYQSGDTNRLGETTSGVVGGWGAAWGGAKLGAEFGFNIGRMTGNPYVIVGATFAGGLVGGGLSYWGGAELGKRFYHDFLKP